MSIRDVIRGLLKDKRLVHVPPQILGSSARRHVFLEARLFKSLGVAMFGKSDADKRRAMLWADIDTFTSGKFISFGDDPYAKDKSAFMARTDPVQQGIFDIRSIDPSPALRLFGAFTEIDTFVGLIVRTRKDLGGRDEPHFSMAMTDAQFEWNKLFPLHAPFYSKYPKEHVSQNVHIV